MTAPIEPGRRDAERAPELGFELEESAWLERVRSATSAPGEPASGKLGEYELLATSGRGGQGVVYRARQPHTGRIVALKRLHAGAFATPEMRARFLREVEAASALEHPNIVAIHGCEVLDAGPVAVLQWIDGVALDQWATPRRAAGELRSIVALLAKVARAVNHAHQRGVLHRDLKPSNILVDAGDEPHVVDFGLAKFHGDERADPSLTESGVFVGTLQYAAPEMALGRRQDVDVRADVYALGAVLFQALTGAHAFEVPSNLAEVVDAFARREPQRPSRRNPSVDRELDAIVLMALASEKERRYASMADFAEDLRRYLAGEAVQAHAPTTRYKVAKLVRRHRVAVAVSGAFAAVLIGASITSTSMYFAAERERVRAEEALSAEQTRTTELERSQRETERERIRQGAGSELLAQILARSTTGRLADGSPVTLRRALDEVAGELPAKAEQHEDQGEAWLNMLVGNAYLDLRDPRAALPHFERAVELRRQLFGPEHLDVAESHDKRGRARRQLGDIEGAIADLSEALRIRRKLLPPGDGYVTVNINSLALALRHAGRLDEAEALFTEALQRYLDDVALPRISVPIVRRNLALTYRELGRLDDAIALHESALAHELELQGDSHPDVAIARVELASLYGAAGRSEEAEALVARSLATIHASLGDRHLTYLQARALLAQLRGARAPQECERELRELVEIHRERRDVRNLLVCLNSLAEHHQRSGASESALAASQEALCEAQANFAAHDALLAEQRLRCAELFTKCGRRAEAEPQRAAAAVVLSSSGTSSQRARLAALE
jgi:tetratricopeptide (TPR) repeat protein/tRNA A-37 threonylcarbamoyl transferase component Bud32